MNDWLDDSYHVSPVWGGVSRRISQQYGPTTVIGEPFRGGIRFHCGIDVAVNSGTPLYAARTGRVGYVGYGLLAIVTPTQCDWYVHVDRCAAGISVGVFVSAGELVAYSGSKVPSGGSSTGAHLHFEVQAVAAARTAYYDANGRFIEPAGALNNPYTSVDPGAALSGAFGASTGTPAGGFGTMTDDEISAKFDLIRQNQVADRNAILGAVAKVQTAVDAIKTQAGSSLTAEQAAQLATAADEAKAAHAAATGAALAAGSIRVPTSGTISLS